MFFQLSKTTGVVLIISITTLLVLINGCGGGGGSKKNQDEYSAGSNKVDEQVVLLRYIGNEVLVPGYEALAQSTTELINSSETFCSSSTLTITELEQLRNAWFKVMDKWQFVQMMRFGPIVKNNYQFRVQFWPDNNNAVKNNVENLLAGSEAITEEVLANASVGAQGIPAMEYLIFKSDEVVLQEFSEASTATKRCQLLNAISANLQTISNDIVNRWSVSGEDYISEFTGKNVAGSGDTRKLDEMVSDVVNTMIEQTQFILLYKLQAPYGEATPGSEESVESWRSRYSTKNLMQNLVALQKIYGQNNIGFSRYLNEVVEADVLDLNMQERLQKLIEVGEKINLPIVEAIASDEQRVVLAELIDLMQSIVTKLEGDFANAMNATVGFNGNDGD